MAAGERISSTVGPEPPELLTLAMIRRHYVPLGARTLYRMIAAGTFPRAEISMGGKVRLWRRQTVERWIEQNVNGAR